MKTPAGWCALAWKHRGVAHVILPRKTRQSAWRALRVVLTVRGADTRCIPSPWRAGLEQYFASGRESVGIPVDLAGCSPFTRRVLTATKRIPPGQVRSYRWVARRIGQPGPLGARAVGQALKRNPVPLLIPCHRVVARDGLGGFSQGLSRKLRLLSLERRSHG